MSTKPEALSVGLDALVGRYVLHPGWVTSKTDGDRHYISASHLAHLYGLRLADCIVMHDDEPGVRGYQQQSGDVHLYPRYDGNYSLPSNAELCGGPSGPSERAPGSAAGGSEKG